MRPQSQREVTLKYSSNDHLHRTSARQSSYEGNMFFSGQEVFMTQAGLAEWRVNLDGRGTEGRCWETVRRP